MLLSASDTSSTESDSRQRQVSSMGIQNYTFASPPRQPSPKLTSSKSERSSRQETFIVQKGTKSGGSAKLPPRPKSGKTKEKDNRNTSASSISAYLQLKKSGMFKDPPSRSKYSNTCTV